MSRNTHHLWHSFAHPTSRRRERQPPTKQGAFHRRLRIEPLEDRRLLALVVVDTLNDTVDAGDGVTSLREAIFATNTIAGADMIEFAASLTSGGPATLTLRQGELAITDSLTINGPGANLLTIDASGSDPTPDVNNGDGSRIFNINDGISANRLEVSISGVMLTGGDVSGGFGGGAILSFENLAVIGATISGNSTGTTSLSDGGGIKSHLGGLVVTNCTITGNSASGSGGGIRQINSGPLTVTGSTISGNVAGADGGGMRLSGGTATITDSSMSGNSSAVDGGAISKGTGHLTVTRSTFVGNSALGTTSGGIGRGGGIWSGGYLSSSLTITDCTFSGNSAQGTSSSTSSPGGGGGIWSSDSLMAVTNSTISGNSTLWHGGGILKHRGSLVVTDSVINDNSASSNSANGGAIFIGKYSTKLTLTSSTISGNSAENNGGGIYGLGGTTITVTGGTINGNSAQTGGGISSFGTLVVTDSLLHGNSAGVGGGIRQFNGSLTVGNSTITGNSAAGNGGGLYLFTSATSEFAIRHSTIVSNTANGFGGGISVFGGTLTLDQTIVAQNTAALGRDLIPFLGAAIDARFNLIGDNVNSGFIEAPVGSPDANGNLIGGAVHGVISPQLAPLGSNGGLTMTHSLLAGSPAIDTGDPSAASGVGTVPTFDQRGLPFLRIFDGRIDIGAFERQSAPGPLVVDTLTDESDADYSPGDFSLREAIELANGYAGNNAITFAAALVSGGPATILLTLGELKINESLAINGLGADLLTIDASGNDPTPDLNNGDGSRVLNIDDGLFYPAPHQVQDVVISGLNLTGGDTAGSGGAIATAENLSVVNSSISGNSAGGSGGGINSSSGILTITSSTISGNSAVGSSGNGGGISAFGGVVTVADSRVTGNTSAGYGGGIGGYKADFTVNHSTISHNSAGRQGGGISARMGDSGLTLTKTVTITDSTITGNSAGSSGGGVSSSSLRKMIVTITNSTISGNMATNRGGGVYMRADGTTNAVTRINDSTVTGNSAGSGGGIGSIGASTPVVVTRTTVSGNTAATYGGGISADRLTVADSTISGNLAGTSGGGISAGHTWITGSTISNNSTAGSGGGIYHFGGYLSVALSTISGNSANIEGGGIRNRDTNAGRNELSHTIIAGNIVASSSDDLSGVFADTSDYNLIGVDTGFTGISEGTNGNQVGTAAAPINPLLGPLADNGGPTMTHALLPGSPAIDAGDPNFNPNSLAPPLVNDQRGAGFFRVVNGGSAARIDVGAYESQGIPSYPDGDYNHDGIANAADYVLWRDTLGSTTNLAANGDDSNSIIDEADYDVWQANFGGTQGESSALASGLPIGSGGAEPFSAMEAAFALFDDQARSTKSKLAKSLGGVPALPDGDALLLLATSFAAAETDENYDTMKFGSDEEWSPNKDAYEFEDSLLGSPLCEVF